MILPHLPYFSSFLRAVFIFLVHIYERIGILNLSRKLSLMSLNTTKDYKFSSSDIPLLPK